MLKEQCARSFGLQLAYTARLIETPLELCEGSCGGSGLLSAGTQLARYAMRLGLQALQHTIRSGPLDGAALLESGSSVGGEQ